MNELGSGSSVAVLGGGISGLASARRLIERGHRVTLYEASDEIGGLATSFALDGFELEKFYHCLLPTDQALLGHVDELGLGGQVQWSESRMGFRVGDRTWPLNTPRDLLGFGPLSVLDRLRLGLLAVRARLVGTSAALDEVTAADFVRGAVGERAFELLWKPLLAAKIGDHYPALPALWLTTRLHREKNVSKEEKGCLADGHASLIGAFGRGIQEAGGQIRAKSPIDRVTASGDGVRIRTVDGARERHDAVLSTLPLPVFQRILTDGSARRTIADLDLDYQGVISAVFLTDRPLTPYYWTPWVDTGTTSQGLIAMSNLVPLERTNGKHVHYLVNYTHRDSALYQAEDADLLERYERDLKAVHPEASDAIVGRFLFRAPFVEPMWTTGYAKRRPDYVLVPGRVYMACTAQLYPRVNSWNSCCEMVDEMMQAFDRDQGGSP